MFRAPSGLTRRAGLLCVPVGGGPPARSPHASFARSGRSRGLPWPCRHPPAPQPPSPRRPRATLQSGGSYYLTLPPPTGTAAASPTDHAPPTSRAATHTTAAIPAGHASLFLWLPRLLLQHSTTAGNTADEIGEHSGSQRDKTLPDQHISRSNGTKFSLLVVKRSFLPVLRMQGEFYPGILVAHGSHPGSEMTHHVHLT